MREPQECWTLTIKVLSKIHDTLEAVVHRTSFNSGWNQHAALISETVSEAINELREHVESSEECERP